MNLLLIAAVMDLAILFGVMIATNIQYYPDLAGGACSKHPNASALVDNRAQQSGLLGLEVAVYGLALIFIIRKETV